MERSAYIGSSDARDIINGNYSTLYKEKKGTIERPDLSDNFKVQLGILTEDFHLDWTVKRYSEAEDHNFTWAKRDKKDEQFFSAFQPHSTQNSFTLGSHPDALLKNEAGTTVPIEVKHTGRWRSAEEAADYYMPQIQHHLICWGCESLLFSVIIGTEEPERILIGYSEEWARTYIDRCDTFWAYMKQDIPPPPNSATQHKVAVPPKMKNSVPLNEMTRRDLNGNNQATSLIVEFLHTKKQAKRHDEVKTELKDMVGDTESELYHEALSMKRNKAGSILFKIHDEDYGQTP